MLVPGPYPPGYCYREQKSAFFLHHSPPTFPPICPFRQSLAAAILGGAHVGSEWDGQQMLPERPPERTKYRVNEMPANFDVNDFIESWE